MDDPRLTDICQQSLAKDEVQKTANAYLGLHDETHGGDAQARRRNYRTMVKAYYDLVTDFYEYGWGQSFHFAPRHRRESLEASLARHEMFLALRLGLCPGMNVVDVGCGVGGPMRTMARFSGASITGVTISDYQVRRGTLHTEKAGLSHLCHLVTADFMHMPFAEAQFDAAFTIEATAHAPDKVGVFTEVARVLKPGQSFAGYEWCMTDRFDASNAEHLRIKKGIEDGDALPDIVHTSEILRALDMAGLDVVESRDLAFESDAETPWYLPLSGSGWGSLKHSPAAGVITHVAVTLLEWLRIAPKGTSVVSRVLMRAAAALVQGGKTGIFTPMFYFRARKRVGG